jgi:hypothetical protein
MHAALWAVKPRGAGAKALLPYLGIDLILGLVTCLEMDFDDAIGSIIALVFLFVIAGAMVGILWTLNPLVAVLFVLAVVGMAYALIKKMLD